MNEVIFNPDFYLYHDRVFEISPWWNLTIIIPLLLIYNIIKTVVESKESILYKILSYGALCLIIIILTVFFYPLKNKYGEDYQSVIDLNNKRLLVILEKDTVINYPLSEIQILIYETEENSEKKNTHYQLYATLYNGLDIDIGRLTNEEFELFTAWNDKYLKKELENFAKAGVENLLFDRYANFKPSPSKLPKHDITHKHYEWELKIHWGFWLFLFLLIPTWMLLFLYFIRRREVFNGEYTRLWIGFFVVISISSAIVYYVLLNYKSKYVIDFYDDRLITHLHSFFLNHNQSDTIYYHEIAQIYMDDRQQRVSGIQIYLNRNKSFLDKIPSHFLKLEGKSYKERLEIYNELLKRL